MMDKSVNDIIGVHDTGNHGVDQPTTRSETITIIAEEFGYEAEFVSAEVEAMWLKTMMKVIYCPALRL